MKEEFAIKGNRVGSMILGIDSKNKKNIMGRWEDKDAYLCKNSYSSSLFFNIFSFNIFKISLNFISN